MAGACSICTHKDRQSIDREIVAGHTLTKIARKYDISYDVLIKHKSEHITRQMATANAMKLQKQALDVFGELENMIVGIKTIVDKARSKNQDGKYLAATRELRNSLELLSRIQFAVAQQELKERELHTNEWGAEDQEYDIELLSDTEQEVFFQLLNKLTEGHTNRIDNIDYTNEWEYHNNIEDAEPVQDTPVELETPAEVETPAPAPDEPMRVRRVTSKQIPFTERKVRYD